MARPLRLEYEGALYHVTSRGNARESIFLDDRDRARFLVIFNDTVKRYGWICHACCLMSNHYHLLVETVAPNVVSWYAPPERRLHSLKRSIGVIDALGTSFKSGLGRFSSLPPPVGALFSILFVRENSSSGKELVLEQLPGLRRARRQTHVSDD